jgi:hypothetical protein
MKVYEGVDVKNNLFFTSALAGEWSASCSGHFTAEEIASSIHWIGGQVSPGTGLDQMGRKKSSSY